MTNKDQPVESGAAIMDSREYTHEGIEEFFDSDLEYAGKYDALAGHVIRADDELSRKTRELILVALACTENRVDPCANHIRDAIDHGASDDEVVKTVQLAGLAGSSWAIKTGSEALERVRSDR